MSRIIEIRPYRGGWQCSEGDGVRPFWLSETAQEDATHYASERARMTRAEIRLLDAEGKETQTLRLDSEWPV